MIRDLLPEDSQAFIFSTWANQINETPTPFRFRTNKYLLVKAYRRAMERVVLSGQAKVKVVCDEEAQDVMHGYIIYEPARYEIDTIIDGLKMGERNTLHFVYVKGAFRKLGLATRLVAAAKLDPNKAAFSTWTNDSADLLKKFPGAIYTPMALFDR